MVLNVYNLVMESYWVEGLFIPPKKKNRKTETGALSKIEPFAKTIWANSPAEAIRLATEELASGQWVEGPAVSRQSEEQRMRAMKAPELPGMDTINKRKTRND
jgi:hypothetical protein